MLEELRRKFIRPSHELSDEFDYAKSMAGTEDAPWRCPKCLVYAVVNNVCQNCGDDQRMRYGDFERDMTAEHWAFVKANLPRCPRKPRHSEKKRAYWSRKQAESRTRRRRAQ